MIIEGNLSTPFRPVYMALVIDHNQLHFFSFLDKRLCFARFLCQSTVADPEFMKAPPLQLAAICATVLLSASIGFSAEVRSPVDFNGATPLQWSERMADSQMARLDGKLAW